MKDLRHLDRYRRTPAMDPNVLLVLGENHVPRDAGMFDVPYGQVILKVIATNSHGWEHVSASLPDRCPNWYEMSHLHRLFFEPGEAAMQLHVPEDDHVNYHPNCLHIWRPKHARIPRPDARHVGGEPSTRAERRAKAALLRSR